MNVPIEFFQVAFVLAVTVVPTVVMVRLLAGREDLGFDALLRTDHTLPWPRGVQEEEPQPWRFGAARVGSSEPAPSRASGRVSDRALGRPVEAASGS